MDVGSPLDLLKNGRHRRARDLGLSAETNTSFDGNQSFPKLGKSNNRNRFGNRRLPLWKHAVLNAADSANCSFSSVHPYDSSGLSQSASELNFTQDIDSSFKGNQMFNYIDPYRGILTVDYVTTQILVSNSVMTDITGYSSQELLGMKLRDLIVREKSSYAFREPEAWNTDCRIAEILSKDGLRIGVSLWTTRTESDGSPRCIVTLEPVRRVIAQFHLDEYGTVLDADEFAFSIFECAENDFLHHNIRKWIPAIQLPEPGQDLMKPMQKQETIGCNPCKSFPLVLYLGHYEGDSEVGNDSDPLPYYTAIIWLFTSISGLLTVNEEGIIQDCNPLFVRLALGYAEEDLLNKPMNDVIRGFPDPEDLRCGEYYEHAVHSNGSVFPIKYFVEGPFEVKGKIIHHVWLSWSQAHLSSLSSLTWQVTERGSFAASTSVSQNGPDGISAEKSIAETSVFLEDGLSGNFSKKYKIVQQIGKGGFGYVHLCTREVDGKQFVVKFINKRKVYPESWIETNQGRLPLEIHFLSTMQHENVVQMIEYMENAIYFQVVMEKHGPGMDLFEFIERTNGAPEDLASYIFGQVITAVQYLHSLRILHRDIKDENMIIDERFRIKIIDFGSAAEFDGEKLFSVFCGTFEYCSPEVLRGKAYRGPELEVWSLGVTLYVLIFACNPFANIEETIKAAVRYPFEISKQLESLLAGMLEASVADRFTLEQIAQSPWLNRRTDISQYDFHRLVNMPSSDEYNICNDFKNLVTSTPLKKPAPNKSDLELIDQSLHIPSGQLAFHDDVDN